MRIGIDARMLGPKQAGLGRYLEELIKHFKTLNWPENTELVFFLKKENFANFDLEIPGVKITKELAEIPWYSLKEQTHFPYILRKAKLDLVHFPHFNVPILYNGKFVVTIHDLIMYHFPREEASTLGPVKYWIKDRVHRLVLRHAIKKAHKIITPSIFTKNDLIKTLNAPEEKIIVTHLAAEKNLLSDMPTTNSATTIFQKQIIGRPYILYVGNAYPHKNLETLIEAWKIFNSEYSKNYDLILAGKKNYFYKKLILKYNTVHNLKFAGFVPDEELPKLYRGASAYVFPSLYEGFGLPPLEVMQYYVPVISSSASCLPEILQDAAYYFDATDPKNIAHAINKILTDKNLRLNLNAKAQELLPKYSWKKTATLTQSIYFEQ